MSRWWLLSPSKEKRNKDQLITGLEATSKNEAFNFALQLY